MKTNKQVDFIGGSLFPLIIRFSVPAAISLLVTAIYNIVDRIFIGNFNGTTALAAFSMVVERNTREIFHLEMQ